jgi:hypothetical protein
MRIKRFNKTIMGPDMLVELMKILKLAMRKAPCLCFCYVLNFWCFEGNVFKELFKKYIFLVQCHMCHQSAKTFHFCFFMFNITMFHFLFVTPFWIFSYLFKNFSLFFFCFLCCLLDSYCSCQKKKKFFIWCCSFNIFILILI